MRVYIVGRMRGMPELNFPAFDAAAKLWRAAGHEVINPADMDREHGFGPDNEPTGEDMRFIFSNDVMAMVYCDALALLPDWIESKFGRIEVQIAHELGMEFFDADTMQPIELHRAFVTWLFDDVKSCVSE